MPATETEVKKGDPRTPEESIESGALLELYKVNPRDWRVAHEYAEGDDSSGHRSVEGFEATISPSTEPFKVRFERIYPNPDPSNSPYRIRVLEETSAGSVDTDYQLPLDLTRTAEILYNGLEGIVTIPTELRRIAAQSNLRLNFEAAIKASMSRYVPAPKE